MTCSATFDGVTWRGAVDLSLVREYLELTRGASVVGDGLSLVGGAALRRAVRFRGPGDRFVGRWTFPWRKLEPLLDRETPFGPVFSSGYPPPFHSRPVGCLEEAAITFALLTRVEIEDEFFVHPDLVGRSNGVFTRSLAQVIDPYSAFWSVAQVIDPLPENVDLRDDAEVSAHGINLDWHFDCRDRGGTPLFFDRAMLDRHV